jgi:hypothetical protein
MTEMTMLERMAEAMTAIDEDLFAVFPRGEELWNVVKLVDDEASELLDESYVVVFTGEREACDHVASQMLHLARARAALEAMHEPTPAMIEAGIIPQVVHGLTVSALYSDMIAAALAEMAP